MTRWHVDAWNPAYGTALEQGDAAGGDPSTAVDTDVERAAASWRPLAAPATVRAPDRVLLVDGVRRIDATLWTEEDDGTSHPAVAASYAAGVVCCDLRRGAAELVHWRLARGLFCASPAATDLVAGNAHYVAFTVGSSDPAKLTQAIQPRLAELEVGVSIHARASAPAGGPDDGDLLVVDGPLHSRRLPRTIGYVKTQRQLYLPSALIPVVTALRHGERTPVFLHGTRWRRYSWYLRLPNTATAPWAGVVRVEAPAELTSQEAIALADVAAATLPRFASSSYKDPRAPQNLIPIAGLERRLRALLGDTRLLHRALTVAATADRRANPGPAAADRAERVPEPILPA